LGGEGLQRSGLFEKSFTMVVFGELTGGKLWEVIPEREGVGRRGVGEGRRRGGGGGWRGIAGKGRERAGVRGARREIRRGEVGYSSSKPSEQIAWEK